MEHYTNKIRQWHIVEKERWGHMNIRSGILRKKIIIPMIITFVVSFFCISTINRYLSIVSFQWNGQYGAALYSKKEDKENTMILSVYNNRTWLIINNHCYTKKFEPTINIEKNLNKLNILEINNHDVKLEINNYTETIQHQCK